MDVCSGLSIVCLIKFRSEKSRSSPCLISSQFSLKGPLRPRYTTPPQPSEDSKEECLPNPQEGRNPEKDVVYIICICCTHHTCICVYYLYVYVKLCGSSGTNHQNPVHIRPRSADPKPSRLVGLVEPGREGGRGEAGGGVMCISQVRSGAREHKQKAERRRRRRLGPQTFFMLEY